MHRIIESLESVLVQNLVAYKRVAYKRRLQYYYRLYSSVQLQGNGSHPAREDGRHDNVISVRIADRPGKLGPSGRQCMERLETGGRARRRRGGY